jgi:glutathione S-transferase
LTLADLAIASPLMHTVAAELPVTGYENLQAWFARVQALEAWKKSAVTLLAAWIGRRPPMKNGGCGSK